MSHVGIYSILTMDSVTFFLPNRNLISICLEREELLIFREKATTAKLSQNILHGFGMGIIEHNPKKKLCNQITYHVASYRDVKRASSAGFGLVLAGRESNGPSKKNLNFFRSRILRS